MTMASSFISIVCLTLDLQLQNPSTSFSKMRSMLPGVFTLPGVLNAFSSNDVEGFCNCKSKVKQTMEIKEAAMVMSLHPKRFTNALQKADHAECISKALYTLYACHLHAAETCVDVEQHNLVLAHLTQQ